MKYLTRFTIFTFLVLIVLTSVLFIRISAAHYNALYITDVTEYCYATQPHALIYCGYRQYIEYQYYISPDDHVQVLDENNNVVYAHKPGHQNHIQYAVWGLTRDDYAYVDGCSQCPTNP